MYNSNIQQNKQIYKQITVTLRMTEGLCLWVKPFICLTNDIDIVLDA